MDEIAQQSSSGSIPETLIVEQHEDNNQNDSSESKEDSDTPLPNSDELAQKVIKSNVRIETSHATNTNSTKPYKYSPRATTCCILV